MSVKPSLRVRAALLVSCATLAVGLSSPSLAQVLPTQPTDSTAPPVDTSPSVATPSAASTGAQSDTTREADSVGNDIVVTAQFREERIQDTPLTIIARDGDFIENRQISSVRDLAISIPGFQSGATYQSAPQYSIRGTRSGTIDISTEDGTATYFDGVYVARPAGTTLDLYELERVEVLKGPQGTLYGRNAVGGVINYITPTPKDDVFGRITADVGNYDTFNLRGRLNMPIVAGKLFANAAFSIRNRDGYVDNLVTGNDIGNEDSWAVRSALKLVATDQLEFVLRGDYNRNKNRGPGFSTIAQTTAQTIITPGAPPRAVQATWFDPRSTDPLLNPTGRVVSDIHETLQSNDGLEERTAYGASLTSSAETDQLNVVSITAYRYLFADQISDFDGTPCIASSTNFLGAANVRAFAPGNPDLLGQPRCITLNDTVQLPFLLNRTVPQAFGLTSEGGYEPQRTDRAKQYSQELRLLSTPGGLLTFGDRLSWVLGGLVFYENARRDQTETIFGVPNARNYYAQNRGLSVGVYSQLNFKVVEGVNLIGGLRYSYDRKRYAFSQQNRAVTAVLAPSGGRPVLVSPLEFSPTINFSNLPGVFGFPTGFPNPALTNGVGVCPVNTRCLPLTRTSESWTSVDPKIGLEVRPVDDVLLYGSYTSGYKGGGFSTTPEDLATGLTPYDPETIEAYEIGAKTSWLRGRLNANIALYRNNSRDVQIQSGYDHDNNPGTRPFVGVRNAARLRAQGVEIELNGRPMRGLSLYSVYAFTDAEFSDFLVFGGGVVVADNSGNRPLNAPRHSFAAGFDYSVPLRDGWDIRANADYSYRSKVFFTENNFPEAAQAGYSLVNASLSLGQEPTGVQLRLWVRNLFDKDYRSHILSGGAGRAPILGTVVNANTYTVIPGPPRTFGLTASYSFGR